MTSGERHSDEGRNAGSAAPMGMSAAELMERLWADMCDVLGTAATATLIRRSVRQAAHFAPLLEAIVIARSGFDYRYSLPESWHEQNDGQAINDLQTLIRELRVLLGEMTGPVVIRRLERIPELRHLGMTLGDEG